MERIVSYLNIPEFYIAVERVLDPGLNNRPVAVAPLYSDRANLWACSVEAKEMGIHKGMPVAMGKRMSGDLILISPRPDLYRKVNYKLQKAIQNFLPLYEFEREGKIFLDFSGFERLYGNVEDFSMKLKKHLWSDFHLECSIGSGQNKLISKVAAKTGTTKREIISVAKGREEKFLAPKPSIVLPVIKEIERGTNRGSENPLVELGLLQVEDLLGLDRVHLQVAFREHAKLVYEMSRGIDNRPICAPQNEEVVAREVYLHDETNDSKKIKSSLHKILEQACYELRERSSLAGKIIFRIRYADFKYLEKTMDLKRPCSRAFEMEKNLMFFISLILKRRVAVSFLGIYLSELTREVQQLNLFEDIKKMDIENSIDDIRKKFGRGKIVFGNEF